MFRITYLDRVSPSVTRFTMCRKRKNKYRHILSLFISPIYIYHVITNWTFFFGMTRANNKLYFFIRHFVPIYVYIYTQEFNIYISMPCRIKFYFIKFQQSIFIEKRCTVRKKIILSQVYYSIYKSIGFRKYKFQKLNLVICICQYIIF